MTRAVRVMEGLCLMGRVAGWGQVRLLMSDGAAERTSVKTSGFRFKPVRRAQQVRVQG